MDKFKINKEMLELTPQQKWENIGLSNDFIFGKVMQNSELCLQLLQRIFPQMNIERIEYPELQKALKADIDSHGIRLDVYVRDEHNRVFDVEMQAVDTGELPKRSRYYQSLIDVSELDAGKSYTELAPSYIIFICMEDIFGEGRHRYTFENRCCENTKLVLQDDTQRIFFNATGIMNDVNADMKNFLDYLTGKISDDPFIQKLDTAVQKARHNREWRQEFMTLEMRDRENFVKGKNIGREEGIEIGKEEGRARGIVEIGYDIGMPEEDILLKLQNKLNITMEKAQEYLNMYGKKAI